MLIGAITFESRRAGAITFTLLFSDTRELTLEPGATKAEDKEALERAKNAQTALVFMFYSIIRMLLYKDNGSDAVGLRKTH
mmetsp:Transcript_7354/g.9806  ORF Transcript_7354/g.9806 Transcript_7354/m.9806 type:complete len:81 (+) Transcript_7354:4528-4770(+)